MKNRIYILKGPDKSGKTSMLKQFIQNKSPVSGFITESRGSSRIVVNIDDKKEYENPFSNHFDEEASKGEEIRSVLNRIPIIKNGIIVVDEIGEKELQGRGFEPAFSAFLSRYKESENGAKLVISMDVILAAQVIEKYGLEEAYVLPFTYDDYVRISSKRLKS